METDFRRRMPLALRALAERLKAPGYAGLSGSGRAALCAAAADFAGLIDATGDGAGADTDLSEREMDVREFARAVLGALHIADLSTPAMPLGATVEKQLVANCEGALADARDAAHAATDPSASF